MRAAAPPPATRPGARGATSTHQPELLAQDFGGLQPLELQALFLVEQFAELAVEFAECVEVAGFGLRSHLGVELFFLLGDLAKLAVDPVEVLAGFALFGLAGT